MTHIHEHEMPKEDKFADAFSKFDLHIHDENISNEVEHLLNDHKAENDNEDVLKFLLSSIEMTSLKVTDSDETILKLVEKINNLQNDYPELPKFASICVYPKFAPIVSQSLEAEGVELACVSGGFPSSQTYAEVKMVETALAIKDGATEIDTVMPVGAFLSGDYETVSDDISETKATCGDCKLKVILETGALQTMLNIKKAAIMAIYSGADFIKTSTGKIEPGASPEAAYVMCKAIKEYYDLTGTRIGFKAAGGLKTVSDALSYYTIVKEVLGKEWLSRDLFRIGTSRLANELIGKIVGKEIKLF